SDEVAKELLINDESVKKQIINTFGKSSYSADGVNLKFLAEQIFSDPEKNQKMNSIVHPPTTDKIDVITKKLFEENNIVFVESAL
ncbi:dephospho-CoA kinase, partial [Salmonella enterica]|uniref:dephospho-CoA kinase n=1 Tax=Salmonella enterica TaxID=28901 RepID=UPI003298EC7E